MLSENEGRSTYIINYNTHIVQYLMRLKQSDNDIWPVTV